MRLNTALARPQIFTHEGAVAKHITPEQQLRRSVLSCLLWEKEFYEDGQSIADRITDEAAKVSKETVAALAVEARNVFGLRHAPLLLLLDLIRRGGPGVAEAIEQTIRRADELGELIALYWRNGKRPLSKQMKLGLGRAFAKFSEYALAKYDRDGAVKLRDVLFLTHPKPHDAEQEAMFKRVAERRLVTPDTWEVQLSGGADKKETFERLIREGKLGYLALLRNLRNMVDAGCDPDLVRQAIIARKGAELVWPFRYVAAARVVPQLEPTIDQALCEAIASGPRLSGKTVVMVDVSGSMREKLSAKSDMTRMDAAAALASVINADARVFTFADNLIEVPARKGMAGVDVITRSQTGGTRLFDAVHEVNQKAKYDRIIVITDEQATGPGVQFGNFYGARIHGERSSLPDPVGRGYMINVASAKNGVGYGRWTHLDGFSEAVIRFITEIESADGDRRAA